MIHISANHNKHKQKPCGCFKPQRTQTHNLLGVNLSFVISLTDMLIL